MPIPPFLNHKDLVEKILPPGIHKATPEEIEASLVSEFSDSDQRQKLFRGWMMFRDWLLNLLEGQARIYVNGSFVTNRTDPSDIDMSVEVDVDYLYSLDQQTFQILSYIFGTPEGHALVKANFGCDAYLVVDCAPDHPRYDLHIATRWPRAYWELYKGPDKLRVPGVKKGYIEAVAR